MLFDKYIFEPCEDGLADRKDSYLGSLLYGILYNKQNRNGNIRFKKLSFL